MPLDNDDTRGSLEHARNRLYNPQTTKKRTDEIFAPSVKNTPHSWQKDNSVSKPEKPHKHVRFAVKFFWIAFVFFFISSGVAGYILFSGDRTVSTSNVSVGIQGPTTIAGGDIVSFQISVTNNNPAAIEHATLLLTLPKGTRSVANVLTAFPSDTEDLGTIAPGGHVERTVKAVLFGAQGRILTTRATLQFKTKGSNAVFVKNKTYQLSVIATPLSVSVDAPAQVIPGQPFTLSAIVRSNSTKPIPSVVLRAMYPVGFTPTHTSIPSVGNNFSLGTLSPGATTTVDITGVISGQDGEKRSINITVGTAVSAKSTAIAVAYMTQRTSITISKPFIATTLLVNGGSPDGAIITPDVRTNISLAWANTLLVPVTNANITVALSGNALDPTSVQVTGGQYQSVNQTIVFSRDEDPSLMLLNPGAGGSRSFSFKTISSTSASSTPKSNPSVTLSVTVSGQYPGKNNSTEIGTLSLTKSFKVATALGFDGYSLYSIGPFRNTGSIPPVANSETTYSVVWNAHTTTSDIAGANVTASMPTDVRFVGAVYPDDGSIVYNKGTHTVAWTVGNLTAGTSRQAIFQVVFTPSVSQQNSTPQLIGSAVFSAFDRYAQVTLSQTEQAITTDLSRDPMYQMQPNAGVVQ